MTNLNFQTDVGVVGFFKLEAHQQDEHGHEVVGSRRVLADWFPNLITNAGLDLLIGSGAAGGAAYARWCHVGSGSAAPSVTDVALQAQIASVSRAQQAGAGGAPNSNVAPRFSGVNFTWQFGQGAAAGNLSEIGVGPTSTGALFSRALIKDSSGNPTTITVLPIEFLTVTYQLRFYFTPTTTNQVFNLIGVNYTATAMWGPVDISNAAWITEYFGAICGDNPSTGNVINSYNGALNGDLVAPSGASGGSSDSVPTTTTGGMGTGAPWRELTWTFGLNQGNAAAPGMTAIMRTTSNDRTWFRPKVGFSPAIPKDNTKVMTVTFRATFGRYVP